MTAERGLFNQTRLLWVATAVLGLSLFLSARRHGDLIEEVSALEDPPLATLHIGGAESVTISLERRGNFLEILDDPKTWVLVGSGPIELPEGLFDVEFGERTWPMLLTRGTELHWDLSQEPQGFGRVPGGPGLSGLDLALGVPTDADDRDHDGAGFLLSLTEVAVEEYASFLKALEMAKPNADGFHVYCSSAERNLFPEGCCGHRPTRGGRDLWSSQNLPEYQRRAVREVSYLDALAYCGFLSSRSVKTARYRLPTKSEWERAARGVDGRPFPWGTDPLLPLKEGVAGLGTTVDSHPGLCSPYGHLHMGSGVSEWTQSPEGSLRYYVMGRSFDLAADRIHVGYAVGESPIVRSASTGFRVLREPVR